VLAGHAVTGGAIGPALSSKDMFGGKHFVQ
jgi:hypothetical protein